MTYKEWLQEGSKYTKGSWKQQVQKIVDDFQNKDMKILKKELKKFTQQELINLSRNAFGFKKSNKDDSKVDFLDKLMVAAKETHDEMQPPKQQIPKVQNKDWSDFEKMLKSHDVYYDRSDDNRIYHKGRAEHDAISAKYNILSQVDKKRADKLMQIIRKK